MKICVDCKSRNVHGIEFRTDYTNARNIYPINDDVEEISNDDLPYRLEGYYCEDCQSLCSVKEIEEMKGDSYYEPTSR